MFYKALGYVVWKSVKFYVGSKLPSRRLLLAGVLAVGAATVVAVGAKRDDGE